MKKQEIKKLSKDQITKSIDKLKKTYLILDFKRLIPKLQTHHRLKQKKQLQDKNCT